MKTIISKKDIKTWILLLRLPFQLSGVFPFLVGSILAFHITKVFDLPVFLLGLTAVVLIMSSTNLNGEIYDIIEDSLSAKLGKNLSSGGSQVIVKGIVPSRKVNFTSHVAVICAFLIGLLLQFYFKTGPWTIPLGLTGIITGFYYAKPPLRWSKRGVGELFIAYSYGWLPVAVGFYLQAGNINTLVHWISLSISCSIFNVILINEFPDYPADTQAYKRNLVVRLGKNKAAAIYAIVAVAGIFTFLISLNKGVPPAAGLFYLPVAIFSLVDILIVSSGKFNNRVLLERICLITILVNLGTNIVYIVGLLI